jgi:hypothetical protein
MFMSLRLGYCRSGASTIKLNFKSRSRDERVWSPSVLQAGDTFVSHENSDLGPCQDRQFLHIAPAMTSLICQTFGRQLRRH